VVAPKQVDDQEYSAQVNAASTARSSYKFGLLGRWRDRDVQLDERRCAWVPIKIWPTGPRPRPNIATARWGRASARRRCARTGPRMAANTRAPQELVATR
jgi:hypothetical protein